MLGNASWGLLVLLVLAVLQPALTFNWKRFSAYKDLLRDDREILVPNSRTPWFYGDYTEMPVVVRARRDHLAAMNAGRFETSVHLAQWFRRMFRPRRLPLSSATATHHRLGPKFFYWSMGVVGDGEEGIVQGDGKNKMQDNVWFRNRTKTTQVRMKMKFFPVDGGKPGTTYSQKFQMFRVGHSPKIKQERRLIDSVNVPFSCTLPLGDSLQKGFRVHLTERGRRQLKHIHASLVKISDNTRHRIRLSWRVQDEKNKNGGKEQASEELLLSFPDVHRMKNGRYVLEFWSRADRGFWAAKRLQYRSKPFAIAVSTHASAMAEAWGNIVDNVLPESAREWLRTGGPCTDSKKMMDQCVRGVQKSVKTLQVSMDEKVVPVVKKMSADIQDACKQTGAGVKHVSQKTIDGTKHVCQKTIEGTKHVCQKTIDGTKHVCHKTVDVTKQACDNTSKACRSAVHETKHGMYRVFGGVEKGWNKSTDWVKHKYDECRSSC